jgi:hypothetical protein
LGYPYPEYTTANTWSQTPKFVCEKLPENARLCRRQPKRAGENQILPENHPTATNRSAGDNQTLAGKNKTQLFSLATAESINHLKQHLLTAPTNHQRRLKTHQSQVHDQSNHGDDGPVTPLAMVNLVSSPTTGWKPSNSIAFDQ